MNETCRGILTPPLLPGIVLNFSSSSSIALRETVFIKPKDVLDSVWATLDVTSASTTKELLAKEKELAM
jgi:hypothetical protein